MRRWLIVWLVSIVGLDASDFIQFASREVVLSVQETAQVVLNYAGPVPSNATIRLEPEFPEVATITPENIVIDSKKSWLLQVLAKEAGYTIITGTIKDVEQSNTYLHVIVSKLHVLCTISTAVGWIYFFAWSISFYPQVYENYKRKSVVGLNFDFVALNVVGFMLYSIFNCGLYYVPSLQAEYFDRHPKGLNPVLFNDVFFSVHAAIMTVVICVQCAIYDRGDQKVSMIAKMILVLYYVIILATGVCALIGVFHWLDFLYYCSFIKLSTTLIKYVPQAVMNYSRKSTVGWSIGNVCLDFTGGSFSMLQMLIDGYNYNDWDNIFGDPTKFGLGMFSVAFDLLFMYQHFVLYRIPYENHVDEDNDSPSHVDVEEQ